MLRAEVHGRGVAKDAQAADDRGGLVAQEAVVAEGFPRVHVRDVDLDEGQGDADERVPQRDGRVCEAAGVDDDGVDAGDRGAGAAVRVGVLLGVAAVDHVEDGALVVGLEGREVDGGGERGAVGFEGGLERSEGGVAVDVGFAEAEEVEVWAVDHEDVFCHFIYIYLYIYVGRIKIK